MSGVSFVPTAGNAVVDHSYQLAPAAADQKTTVGTQTSLIVVPELQQRQPAVQQPLANQGRLRLSCH